MQNLSPRTMHNTFSKDPLWLCLYWPMLPLIVFNTCTAAAETLEATLATTLTKTPEPSPEEPHTFLPVCKLTHNQAQVVFEHINQKRRICYANPAAQQKGISIGMSLGSANSLCASLHSQARNIQQEQAFLTTLSEALTSLTPYITVDHAQNCIYLEIGTCLKLHKGIHGFQARLTQLLGAWAQWKQSALGPTIECSAVFAQQYPGDTSFYDARTQFWQQWYKLPIAKLLLPSQTQQALLECGFTHIADLVQLNPKQRNQPKQRSPKHAFTEQANHPPQLSPEHLAVLKRRFGQNFISYWHRLCGQHTTLRQTQAASRKFDETLNLPFEAQRLQSMLPAIQTLLSTLEHFLIQHHASILSFSLAFTDTRNNSRTVTIRLTHPHHRAAHFYGLTELKLQKHQFQAPVTSIRLYTSCSIIQQNTPLDLFDTKDTTEATGTLIERLQARLGNQTICTILPLGDYRPEQAYTLQPVSNSSITISTTLAKQNPKTLKTPRSHSANFSAHPQSALNPKRIKKHTSSLKHCNSIASHTAAQQPAWLITPTPITEVHTQAILKHSPQGPLRQLPLSKKMLVIPKKGALSHLKIPFGLTPLTHLDLLQGPHYLLTGWWDNLPANRAYYIARTPHNGLYWVFQELITQQWFLQGFFS